MATKKKTTTRTTARKSRAGKGNSRRPATTAIAQKQTKTQVIAAIAEETGLSRAQVAAVFASLGRLIARHMKPRGSGEFTIPDTGVRIRRVRKPATKARMARNPRTGEPIRIPAKPAHNVIKLTALKALKETVAKK